MEKELFINIVKGEEYKVCEIQVDNKKNLFNQSFIDAASGVKEVIASNSRHKGNYDEDMLNNIIAFCGERGQGKSSAMFSFAKYLHDNNDKTAVFGESMSEYQFHVLKAVDPTRLEKKRIF